MELIEDALNGRTPTAYYEREDGSRVVNQPETTAAREKQQQIEDRFREWVWEDPERAARLARDYNERFNNLRLRKFKGSHLTLPGMVREQLRDHDLAAHQKDAVWRILQSGSTLLVGPGKTRTMAAAAMEMRRMGLVRAGVSADRSLIEVGRLTMKRVKLTVAGMRLAALCLLTFALLPSLSRAQQVPVFAVTRAESSIKFNVEASIDIKGTFDKWDATLTFTSPDVTSGVLDVKVQAASVDTGSSLKNGTLKGKDFFDVDRSPLITFRSTKIVQSGPNTLEVDGDFTIRRVTRSEKVTLAVSGKGTGSGQINGTLYFDRKDYGMNSGIPFIRIANRVEVTVALKGKRVSGPPLVFKQ